jgi:hypothetical protein
MGDLAAGTFDVRADLGQRRETPPGRPVAAVGRHRIEPHIDLPDP